MTQITGNVLVNAADLYNIADEIRFRSNTQETYKPSEMASTIATLPNSYTVSDEGKVINNGTLVTQSSLNVSQNGTYDTTVKNSVTVNVLGGEGSSILIPKVITANGTYDPADDSVDGYSNVTVNVQSESKTLPSEYQEVEYLESDGNQYFIVNKAFSIGAVFAIKATVPTSTSEIDVIGTASGGMSIYFQSGSCHFYTSSNLIPIYGSGSVVANAIHEAAGIYKSSGHSAFAVFGYLSGSSVKYKYIGRIYYVRVFQVANGVSYADIDLVPCYRKSDNEPGMYDVVNNIFYTNSDTGEFSVGPDVN